MRDNKFRKALAAADAAASSEYWQQTRSAAKDTASMIANTLKSAATRALESYKEYKQEGDEQERSRDCGNIQSILDKVTDKVDPKNEDLIKLLHVYYDENCGANGKPLRRSISFKRS